MKKLIIIAAFMAAVVWIGSFSARVVESQVRLAEIHVGELAEGAQ